MRNTSRLPLLVVYILLFFAAAGGAWAQQPFHYGTWTLSAKLTTPAGHPVPDGAYTLHVAIYDTMSGGSPFWTETIPVQVSAGLLFAEIGLNNLLPLDQMGGTLYLGFRIGNDAEMQPRQIIRGAPFAHRAHSVSPGAVGSAGLASDNASLTKVAGGAMASAGGRIGIGTAEPRSALEVRGDIRTGSQGELFVPGAAENLRIVRGLVNVWDGAILSTSGQGFTVIRINVGRYRVAFTPQFNGAPALLLQPGTTQTPQTGLTMVHGTTLAEYVDIFIRNLSGTYVDASFSFVALAER